MVSGNYKKTFKEATHVLFDGSLNNPYFRKIAIQKIISVSDNSLKTDSNDFKIRTARKGNKTEFVVIEYKDLFGTQSTRGYPFKDEKTTLPA